MSIYRELGVEPVINAAGTLTRFGGSLMPPEVVEAMVAASRSFVDMNELHLAAGRRIAGLLDVEAAHVCSGAASAITLMAAACMAGSDAGRILRLPDTTGMRRRFVVQRSQRNPYDQALRTAGGEFVEIDADRDVLTRALSEDVAAVFYTIAWFSTGASLPLLTVTEIAHRAGIPVIVDAAAEVPPADNLTRFVREGADLVAFSGGKAMRGPQSSGVILGRQDLIEACRLNDCPNHSIGRPMKAGKEEIVGLVRAIELYVGRDHAADMALWEARVAHVVQEIAGIPHVRAWRQLPFGIGQLIPHAAVGWDEQAIGVSHQEIADRLLHGKPRIAVQLVTPQSYRQAGFTAPELRIHPHTLQDDEAIVVAQRLRHLLSEASRRSSHD